MMLFVWTLLRTGTHCDNSDIGESSVRSQTSKASESILGSKRTIVSKATCIFEFSSHAVSEQLSYKLCGVADLT